jgi:hypothetical protein
MYIDTTPTNKGHKMTTQLPTVGKAVYLEFRKGSMTTQVLFMPEGMASSHTIVPLSMYRRRISEHAPRKTWRLIAGTTTTAKMAPVTSGAVSNPAAASMATTMLTFADPLFTQLSTNNWKLLKEPVVVEVTADDLECVRTGKTPYKALGRIWKARKFLGFPAEFIDKHIPAV